MEEFCKMKFKKLVAALSAVTMLGSLAVAVPASAEETPVVAKVTNLIHQRLRMIQRQML